MNPWWRRPSAESASSATHARNEQKSEERSRRSKPQSSSQDGGSQKRENDEDRPRGGRGRRRGGRRRGRRSSEKQARGGNERSQEKSQNNKGRRKEKTSRIAVILDLARASEGYGSCDWTPESASELIDRALQSTLGAPNGSRVYLRAYAPWDKFEADSAVLDEAGVERIDTAESGTVRMVVDAVERSYGRNPCDTFVLISASDELAPLAERLCERKRTVHACGFKANATPALEAACSTFSFLDDEPKIPEAPAAEETSDTTEADAAPKAAKAAEVVDPFALLHQAAEAVAEEGGAVWGTLVRQTMQSMHPGFTEADHGYSNFAAMLEEAQRRGIVALERDSRSETYYLSGLATAS